MPVWTTPKTWSSEPLLSTDMNTHIRDNLLALKVPPAAAYMCNEVANYVAGVAFAAVDAVNLSFSLTTTGGDLLIGFSGATANNTISAGAFFDVYIDGSPVAGNDGIIRVDSAVANQKVNASFTWLARSIAAGNHTVTLYWKCTAGVQTLYAGAGTAGMDLHPQFWVREV